MIDEISFDVDWSWHSLAFFIWGCIGYVIVNEIDDRYRDKPHWLNMLLIAAGGWIVWGLLVSAQLAMWKKKLESKNNGK